MYDPTNSRYRFLILKSYNGLRRFPINVKNSDQETVIIPKNDIPAHGSYGALLFKPEWRAKREEILIRDNRSCVICKNNLSLQVHHRQYHFVVKENQFKLPWQYPGNLLITLCESCHKRGHSKFKVPIINI